MKIRVYAADSGLVQSQAKASDLYADTGSITRYSLSNPGAAHITRCCGHGNNIAANEVDFGSTVWGVLVRGLCGGDDPD